MKQYLDLLRKIRELDNEKDDRTGVGTYSLFGHQMRFDLSEGFPLVTTKKTFLKAITSELLWFIEGSTNERRLAEIHYGLSKEEVGEKFTIWQPNSKDKQDNVRFNGYNIGNMYGTYWRQFPLLEPSNMVYIERKTFQNHPYQIIHPEIEYIEYVNSGKEISTKDGVYTILGKLKSDEKRYVIKFKETGFITDISKPTKSLKDKLKPSVENKGYIGYHNFEYNDTYFKLYRIWQDMIIRCYNPRKNHASYKDTHVSNAWLNFSEFYKDVFSLPFYQEFIDSNYDYDLDKDYYGSNLYCREACIFINKKINKSLNSGGTSSFKIYEYKDKFYYSKTDLELSIFGKRRKNSDEKLLKQGVKIHLDSETHLVRPKLFEDQLDNLIAEIKRNPSSRRLVLNAWNPSNSENAVLATCHNTFQLYVSDGKLSCQLYQRSADVFLGVPFNIASYAMLTMMIAQVCDLEVGDFIHTFGDVHIYKNHIEQVDLQLSREPHPLPTLKINPDIKNIDDFKIDDFELIDYVCHPSIKAEMAV